jgi:bacillithiol biosynthesis cysteine-adding enzyme BshC
LFTLLKALTALKLADRVSRDQQVPAVAVFWIDAEDHDWNEVRSCTVFDESLTPRTIALPVDAAGSGTPIASITLGQSIETALQELEGYFPSTEFRDGLMADLRAVYRQGLGMAEAFGRWLERALGDRGLVVYDASDPATKPLVASVFARELTRPGETVAIAARAGADLVSRGYHAQVTLADDTLAVFHLDGTRRPIRHENGRFVVGNESYLRSTLVAQATAEPRAFSPNVLLRPVVQDTLFPTVAYVAGPNELAYLAQLRNVYEHFGVPMPLMYARASATLVDAGALRFLAKHSIAVESLQPQDEAVLNALLANQIPPAVEASFTNVAEAVDKSMGQLAEALPGLDPTLGGAATSTLGKMQRDLQTLHGKMVQAAKRRDVTLRRQFLRTRSLVFPNGRAQEREIGFVSFLNQYGPALIQRLDEELVLDPGQHWLVSI